MILNFTKMQGAGNDFIVVDATREPFSLTGAQIRQLADRHFGIGADQLLVVEPATVAAADFKYRIFNADGGEVEHCGNGARCFVKFVHARGLTTKRSIDVEVANGIATLMLEDDGQVRVEMGAPTLSAAAVPFDADGLTPARMGDDLVWPLDIGTRIAHISVLGMGNPHAVQVVDDVERWPVATEGPAIEAHPRFARRVNAGFMQIIGRHAILLRVFERGAGETLACGTGACAAVVAGIRRGLLDSPVRVGTHGGDLTIAWDGLADAQAPVMMSGPAQTVFEGRIEL